MKKREKSQEKLIKMSRILILVLGRHVHNDNVHNVLVNKHVHNDKN